ncbi:MBOAT-domain-containing protein [Panus rudis PR-1116 ss-1]|nr:MBOAT-domain-containing protein [Panus rudis PR-1116 ss-1]
MPTDLRREPHGEPYEFDSVYRDQRKGITKLTVEIPSSSNQAQTSRETSPSRWGTPEFMFYAIAFCLVVPIMFWIPIKLSSSTHPNYTAYSRRLSQGWMFGRKVDNTDHQYRTFRGNVPVLSLLVIFFLSSKAAYVRLNKRKQIFPSIREEDNLYLVPFIIAFSVLMLIGLHGMSALKVMTIFATNYAIAKYAAGSKLNPILTWVFNVAVLFASEKFSGFHYTSIHPSLGYLDTFDGVYRWHVGFNISMLRLISFNMDYFWACNLVGKPDSGQSLDYKDRPRTYHSLNMYRFPYYLAYALYPPLYIGGPIITYNDFLWQLCRPIPMPLRKTLGYLARFLVCILTLEFILHFMYVVAIKNTKAWAGDTVAELSMVGFWNLIIVWLKLLVPWRFFRLWALLDGVDPPENMVRCMVNNYSAKGFWRAWHRSYNLWIVRYIYIPLGGTGNVVFTTLLVFTFVALWHDLSFKLLAWGWLVSLFILPELIAQYLLPASKYGKNWWYRHICAFGAVFNILMMMAANLVGFVIGTDGMSYMLKQLFSTWEGIRFLFFACICLFIASQVMFEYREEEKRRGIYRRC